MPLRFHILLIFLLPVVIIAGLVSIGKIIPVPHFGRDYVIRITLPDADTSVELPQIMGAQDRSRPLVVIDPGHGGHDPGASGAGVVEKDLVLALARELRDKLVEMGGVRVAMTRDEDNYVSLSERPFIARQLDADLFISIHADSAGDIQDVSGASVYTLSAEASSEAAARFAERENNVDAAINGVMMQGQNASVNSILIDLSRRQTLSASDALSGLILREGKDTIVFHPRSKRSADLAVLKAPDIPAVLYESGYITNPDDAARLSSDNGKSAFAESLARAIRIFFAEQSVR